MPKWLPPLEGPRGATKHRRIVEAVLEGLADGTYPPGENLPSTRALAARFRVDRSTVLAALAELKMLGAVETTIGSGTRAASVRAGLALAPWVEGAVARPFDDEGEGEGEVLDFTLLRPDESLFPMRKMQAVLQAALVEEGEAVAGYADPMGYAPLREWIARRLGARPEQVLLVNGAQQGLSLLCQLLLSPGARVLVESPTYAGLLPLLRLHQAEAVPLPLGGEGPEPAALALHAASPFKFLYLQPSHHNPTGATMGEEARRRVLKLLPRHQVCLVEDSADLVTGDRRTLFELDPAGRVVTLGSFSKLMLPGFRVGWIAGPPEVVRACARLKALADLHAPVLLQAALHRFLGSPEFPAYLERSAAQARRKEALLRRLLRAAVPARAPFVLAPSSSSLWLPLPPGRSARAACRDCLARGVRVSPGDWFYPLAFPPQALRAVFAHAGAPDLETLASALGAALARQSGRPAARPAMRIPS